VSQLPLERAKAMLGAGAFLARVLNVRDPENRNRLQVQILDPSAIGSQDGVVWARVMVPFAGDSHGTLSVPEVGCEVLVIFLAGDSRSPVVLGDMWNGSDKSPVPLGGSSGSGVGCTVAEKAGMKISILEDSAGYTIQLMTPGQVPESVNRATPSLLVPAAAAPTSIRIDANGISIATSAAQVQITAASKVSITAPQLSVNAASSTFSGVVECQVLQATTVVAATITPAGGNVW